jgi:hypothetical protein
LRLVELLRTDIFADVTFISYLIGSREWLEAARRQAMIYNEIGDIGVHTDAFRTYRESVKQYVVEKLRPMFRRSPRYLESFVKRYGDDKARRAWSTIVTLLASQQLLERAGAQPGELLPEEYAKLEYVVPLLNDLIEEKTRSSVGAPVAARRVFERLGEDRVSMLAPLLWWLNMIMESEVLEGILKFHYIVSKKPLMRDLTRFVETVEGCLSEIENHRADLTYMEYEVLKSLMSRCVELRGQYINKLQLALLFVKLWRRSVRRPEEWRWFLKDDVLTYALAIYLAELQTLLGLGGRIKLDIASLLAPEALSGREGESRRSIYGSPASVLLVLILMSPIFMQYAIEARSEVAVVPADIIVALLRIMKYRGETESFLVHMRDIVDEILKFWEEKDLTRRLKLYVRDEISPNALYSKRSLTVSLSLVINASAGQLHIFTTKKPELLLPPRMIGFDSLYVTSGRFSSILRSIWA